mmetsp:Transcript_8809/g.18074  ORF Transcript_8809/g.18074 Transcript_8809/m.18074 type:complete len:257 (-) Transcript_8809:134-904(-)
MSGVRGGAGKGGQLHRGVGRGRARLYTHGSHLGRRVGGAQRRTPRLRSGPALRRRDGHVQRKGDRPRGPPPHRERKSGGRGGRRRGPRRPPPQRQPRPRLPQGQERRGPALRGQHRHHHPRTGPRPGPRRRRPAVSVRRHRLRPPGGHRAADGSAAPARGVHQGRDARAGLAALERGSGAGQGGGGAAGEGSCRKGEKCTGGSGVSFIVEPRSGRGQGPALHCGVRRSLRWSDAEGCRQVGVTLEAAALPTSWSGE